MKLGLPKLIEALRGYSLRTFLHDLLAGVTVGLVALPLAMAFAISSGMPPESGIYGAVVAGFIISALGGSRFQIGGPTGAFVVVISGIVVTHGVEGLFLCTLMAGIILVLLGLTGLGAAVKFIPRPIIVGFTNGIAVLIASTQVKDLLGLRIDQPAGAFVPRLREVVENLGGISPASAAMGMATLLVLILFARFVRRVPGAIVALFLATAAVALAKIPVETIGSRFGGIPSGLPPVHIPPLRLDLIAPLLSPAVTVAMLGAIESLMSAVVADKMSGDRHNPNVELFAQGVANIASPLVGGLPATGAIARTATNIRSGARTPISGILHAATLLVILVAAAPLARFVPLAALSAILLITAYNMGDWEEIPEILRLSKGDISVWLITFALTVFADLTLAVEVGMILAGLLFIRKIAATTTVAELSDEEREGGGHEPLILPERPIPDYVAVFRVHGPLLFGSADKVREITDRIDELAPVVVLRLQEMSAIDATGLSALEEAADALHSRGLALILCGAREQPGRLMRQAEFFRHVGRENLCANLGEALARAEQIHQEKARQAIEALGESKLSGWAD
ncbi:MAG TPA: SulP family inorganic anion transporter [Candidatus Eisenbacteria bacterium]|nr:SulP family inorganic anion transporter [Candidatus Eisenbacteria bacterium]